MFTKVNQTKKNLQKYFHPSTLNQLIYAHQAMLRATKGQKKVPTLKKTTLFITLWLVASSVNQVTQPTKKCDFFIIFKPLRLCYWCAYYSTSIIFASFKCYLIISLNFCIVNNPQFLSYSPKTFIVTNHIKISKFAM